MDALLGVLLVAAGFALFIFLVDRSAKYIVLVGAAIVFAAALVMLGVMTL
ncbi:MAG: hypothetical protein OEM29_04755 [Thermoplasmata archaeon]|nr:hypothetical protein [Thermoplasmata archaeon]